MYRLFAVLFLSLALLACTERGPAERAGAAVDDAADRIGDAARDARDEAQDIAQDIRSDADAADEPDR